MDPFALQDEARRNTGRLVALAVIAVVAVVAAAAFVFACGAWIIDGFLIEKKLALFSSFIASPTVIAVSLLVSILIVLIGFLVKMDDLASAESLMKSVGAERIYRSKIHGNDNDSLARLRLFNVCEEMSISSGVSMPSIWVLPKSLDVNAFVAGESPETSAISRVQPHPERRHAAELPASYADCRRDRVQPARQGDARHVRVSLRLVRVW